MVAVGAVQGSLPTIVLFVAGGVVFALWWAIAGCWALSALFNVARHRDDRAGWWRWILAPPLVLAVMWSPAGFDLRFWLSRPALERLAAKTAAVKPGVPAAPDQVVVFVRVLDARRLSNGGFRFATLGFGHPFDYDGLAYSPRPLPENTEIDGCYFWPYCGPWYGFWRPSGDADGAADEATGHSPATAPTPTTPTGSTRTGTTTRPDVW